MSRSQYGMQTKQGFWGNVREFFTLLAVVIAIRVFVFGLYQVPTGSMETTMLVGERFFADKLTYFFRAPHRGEVIAFNAPDFKYSANPVVYLLQQYLLGPVPFNWGPDNWTKRVIGIPGDHVEGKIEDGKPVIYLNGVKLDEPYINKYPLIQVWRSDPQQQLTKIEKELEGTYGRSKAVDKESIERFILERLDCCPRSYDPSASYEKQPFYRLNPERIVSTELIKPGSLIRPDAVHDQRMMTKIADGKNAWNGSDVFSVKLGPDEYWGMGDNRLGSRDCRSFGPIKAAWIHGRILFRIWSMDSSESWWIVDLIKHPIDFWTRMRWSRFFQWIY